MKRVFITVGGGFLFGSFCSNILPFENLKIIIAVLIFLFIISCIYKTKTKVKTLVFVLFFILGICTVSLKNYCIYNKILSLENTSKQVTATITNVTPKDNGFEYDLYINDIKNSDIKNFKTIFYTNMFIDADLYDTISLNVNFFKPASTKNFDGINYYKAKNIYLLSNYYDFSDNQVYSVQKNNNKPLIYYIKNYNKYLSNFVENNFSINVASIVNSMVLGNSDTIPFELKSKYNDTGTSHIFAISGLHIGIIFFLLNKLFSRTRFLIKTLFPLTIIVFYILISGMQISSIRSMIMIFILILSKLLYRKSDLLNTLFLTGFIIVFINPYAVIDISFQMSFLATLGIILFTKKIEKFILLSCHLSFLPISVISCIAVSISANLMLIPCFIYYFKFVNMLSPIIYLVISPFPAIILTLSFIYILICPIVPYSALNKLISLTVNIQNYLIKLTASVTDFIFGLDYLQIFIWFEISILLVAIYFILKNHFSIAQKSICFLIAFLFFISNISITFANNTPLIYVIGDGESSNIIIHSNKNTTVISTNDDDYIDTQTVNFLKGKGIKKIDNFIISYTNFNKYTDTVNLIKTYEISNIFINKTNTNAFYFIKDYYKNSNILPIYDTTEILLSSGFKISFSYLIKNVNILIKYNNFNINICDQKSALKNSVNTLYFIRGNIKSDYKLNEYFVYLLDKPYYKGIDNNYKKLYNDIHTFSLKTLSKE